MTKLFYVRVVYVIAFLLLTNSKMSAQLTNSRAPLTQSLLLHLSKSTIKSGDKIGFKCYVINNVNHIGEDNNLYVLLSKKNGEIISKEKYPIINSSTYGTIEIPNTLESGEYYIETFTPYLINNNTIKQNKIIVSNPSTNNGNNINCKFYFNNNRLISNIANTFFVKTTYDNGTPASTDVTIIDKDNNEIKKLVTDINGIAKVNFTPFRGQKYNVLIGTAKQKLPFTNADSLGVNLQVSFEKSVLSYLVNKNYKIPVEQDSFTVIVYQKETEIYKEKISFEKYASVSGGVDIAGVSSGILKAVLQNNNKEVISSTYIYVNNAKNFDIVNNKNGLAQNITTYDLGFKQPANRFMSVSLESNNNNLESNFDIFYNSPTIENGQVVDFFEIGNANSTKNNLGYTEINAATKLAKQNKIVNGGLKILNDYGINISGKAYDYNSSNALSNGYLTFTYQTIDSNFKYTVKVKSDGTFMLDSVFFNGNQKIEYSYVNNKNNDVECVLKLDNSNEDYVLDSILKYNFDYAIKLNSKITNNTPTSDIAIQVNDEDKKEKKIEENTKKFNPSYSTGVYVNGYSSIIDNIKYPPKDGALNGGNFVRNNISNIGFQGGNVVNLKNMSMASGGLWPIGIFIDEVPATLADLNLLQAKDIGIVKFFEPGHVSVSSQNSGGSIVVYTIDRVLNNNKDTYKYNANATKKVPLNQSFDYIGFSKNNIMFSSKKTIIQSQNYSWYPLIIAPKTQTSYLVDFTNLEPNKNYKLIVRGYNDIGQFINVEEVIKK